MSRESTPSSRRHFLTTSLTTGTGLALGALATPTLAQPQPQAQTCEGAMPLADYQRYLELFNNNDERFIEYYHPEVELQLGDSSIHGAEGIRDFYAEVKQHIRETVTLDRYVADANGVAVIIPTHFECIRDWNDSFWGIDLEAGQTLDIVSWGFYRMQEGRFAHIMTTRAQGGEWATSG